MKMSMLISNDISGARVAIWASLFLTSLGCTRSSLVLEESYRGIWGKIALIFMNRDLNSLLISWSNISLSHSSLFYATRKLTSESARVQGTGGCTSPIFIPVVLLIGISWDLEFYKRQIGMLYVASNTFQARFLAMFEVQFSATFRVLAVRLPIILINPTPNKRLRELSQNPPKHTHVVTSLVNHN